MHIVTQLNTLLQSLHIPFTLLSPTDLTPSLLLLILESILGHRLTIDHSNADSKRTRQIQTIKVFLGVLEIDVLKRDVGLSSVDPRKLAEGAWDEVCFVAEVLCCIGRELPTTSNPHEDASLSSPSSSITFLPPLSPLSPLPETLTSSLLLKDNDTDSVHTLITSPRATSSPVPTPLPALSTSNSSLDIDMDDNPFRTQHVPIRTQGYIDLVDHESEISSFLNSPNQSFTLSPTLQSTPKDTRSAPNTPHKQTQTRTRLRSQTQTQTPTRNQIQRDKQDKKDLNTLLTKSPEYDPRKTLELLHTRTKLMQDLLSARMNRAMSRSRNDNVR